MAAGPLAVSSFKDVSNFCSVQLGEDLQWFLSCAKFFQGFQWAFYTMTIKLLLYHSSCLKIGQCYLYHVKSEPQGFSWDWLQTTILFDTETKSYRRPQPDHLWACQKSDSSRNSPLTAFQKTVATLTKQMHWRLIFTRRQLLKNQRKLYPPYLTVRRSSQGYVACLVVDYVCSHWVTFREHTRSDKAPSCHPRASQTGSERGRLG